MDVCLLWVFVLSGRGLCDGPIPRPEESYRLRCVSECDQVKIKTIDTYCEQVGRSKDYESVGESVVHRSIHRSKVETVIMKLILRIKKRNNKFN
jgi:hypothetical protein